jgi:hypothetical protein
MRLSTAPLLSATLLALPSWSAPTLDTTKPLQVFPDKWVQYDLNVPIGGNSSSTGLERRQNVNICQAIATAASCIVIGNNMYQVGAWLSGVIKDASNRRSCGTFSGSGYGLSYRYQANGKNCDTTAEQATIAGVIEHHIKSVGNGAVCNTECLDLTHDGSWDGFLLIGPSNNFDSSIYCGPSLSFGQCSNGGKNDFQ